MVSEAVSAPSSTATVSVDGYFTPVSFTGSVKP